MSTLTGQSPLQPLHERHRSSASFTLSSRQRFLTTSPFSISHSKCARPRVVCFSSCVTMKLGHIVWFSGSSDFSRRHLPTPTHRSVAWEKLPPSCGYLKCVFGSHGL